MIEGCTLSVDCSSTHSSIKNDDQSHKAVSAHMEHNPSSASICAAVRNEPTVSTALEEARSNMSGIAATHSADTSQPTRCLGPCKTATQCHKLRHCRKGKPTATLSSKPTSAPQTRRVERNLRSTHKHVIVHCAHTQSNKRFHEASTHKYGTRLRHVVRRLPHDRPRGSERRRLALHHFDMESAAFEVQYHPDSVHGTARQRARYHRGVQANMVHFGKCWCR